MLGIFLVAMAALLVTASGRRISAMYIPFASLYDLALSANDQAKLLLVNAANHDDIMAQIEELYADGEVLGEYKADLFFDKKSVAITGFMSANFGRGASYEYGEHYFFYYRLTTSTGTYHVRTSIYPQGRVYNLRSSASKNEGTPIHVYGRIQWCELSFQPSMVRAQLVSN